MCSFITTLWLPPVGGGRGILQTGMGAHLQLLSRLYVSSEDWPSSLMSSLMIPSGLGWTQPSSPSWLSGWRARAWGHERLPGLISLPDWTTALCSLCSSRFFWLNFFGLHPYFFFLKQKQCLRCQHHLRIKCLISSYWGFVRKRHLLKFLSDVGKMEPSALAFMDC